MLLRLVLGAVYTAMALGQALSWSRMPEILGAYQVPGVASRGFVAALIAAELAGGVWLLTRPRSHARIPAWIYTGVTVVWAGLGVQGIMRGLDVANCGCFGVHLAQRLSWFVLAQDALLLVYAYLMLRAARRARSPVADRPRGKPDRAARG